MTTIYYGNAEGATIKLNVTKLCNFDLQGTRDGFFKTKKGETFATIELVETPDDNYGNSHAVKCGNEFVGNGRKTETYNFITFSLDLTKMLGIKEIPTGKDDHFLKGEKNGHVYAKLMYCENKDGKNQYGQTHYVKANTYVPKPKQQPAIASSDDGDLPF